MSKPFEAIRIVSLDATKTQPSKQASGLRHIYLKLSDSPPDEWIALFDKERGFARHTMWRDAWIEGPYIVVDCVPDEIEKHHLSDLKEDVKNSNAKYIEWAKRHDEALVREVKAQRDELEKIREIGSRLKFDV